MVTMITARG